MIHRIIFCFLFLANLFAENISICGKTVIYTASQLVDEGAEIEVGGSRQVADQANFQATILRLGLQSGEIKLSTSEVSVFIDCLLDNNYLKESEVVLIWGIKQAVVEVSSINKIINRFVISGYPLDQIVSEAESDSRSDILGLIFFLTGIKSEKLILSQSLVEQILSPMISVLISKKDFTKLREVAKRFDESEELSAKDKVELAKLIFEIEILSENKLNRNFKSYDGRLWRKELQKLYQENALKLAKNKPVWTSDEYLNFILSIDLDNITEEIQNLVRSPLANNSDIIEPNISNPEFSDKLIYFINTNSIFKSDATSILIKLFEKSIEGKSDEAETVFNILANCGLQQEKMQDLQFSLSQMFREKGDSARANQYYTKDPKKLFRVTWFCSVLLVVFFTSYLLVSKYRARKIQQKPRFANKNDKDREMPVFSQKAAEISGERRALFNKLRELDLPIDANQKQVKAKYRSMVKHLHPDLNKDLSAVDLEKFTKYTQIYDEIIALMKSLKVD